MALPHIQAGLHFSATRLSWVMNGYMLQGAGGAVTEWLSWRWVLFVNVPIGLAVLALTPAFVTETPRLPGKFDLAGAVTSTVGVAALVYGFIRACRSSGPSG